MTSGRVMSTTKIDMVVVSGNVSEGQNYARIKIEFVVSKNLMGHLALEWPFRDKVSKNCVLH